MELTVDDLETMLKDSPTTTIPMSTQDRRTTTMKDPESETFTVNSDLFTLIKTWSKIEDWTDLTVHRHIKHYHTFSKLVVEGVIKLETGTLIPSHPGHFIMMKSRKKDIVSYNLSLSPSLSLSLSLS